MRSYLWFNADGTFGGAHGTCDGGFLPQHDMTDPNSTSPLVAELKSMVAVYNPQGWVSYDCACPSSLRMCSCCHHRVSDSYLNNGVMTRKPGTVGNGMTVLLNGTNANSGCTNDASQIVPINLTPGASATFQLSCPGIPDGTSVTVKPTGLVHIIQAPTVLTFTNGLTNVINIVAPAQGMIGAISGASKLVMLFNFHVRGWA